MRNKEASSKVFEISAADRYAFFAANEIVWGARVRIIAKEGEEYMRTNGKIASAGKNKVALEIFATKSDRSLIKREAKRIIRIEKKAI